MVLRNTLHRFLPTHFKDPLGLFIRLIRSKDPAALFAIQTSLLALVSLPLDVVLQSVEKRRYKNASPPKLPVILVTGAARSGTTLVAQALIQHLPVAYFNNLTAVFQRSPITANRMLKPFLKNHSPPDYTNYYGKTTRFSGPHDALHIWDRWLGKDRTRIPTAIEASCRRDMVQFFGAFQEAYPKPLVNKNNNLNTFAHLVAEVLDTAHFICIRRDPLYHAQSLYIARKTIHGDENVAYGLRPPGPDDAAQRSNDAVTDVCEQVLFHARVIEEQQRIIGGNRFWIVPYEEFCEKPAVLVRDVAQKILKTPVDTEHLPPFRNANRRKVDADTFERLRRTLEETQRTQ